MKLIKKGRPQKGWAKQFNCTGKGHGGGGCKAVLMIEESDLRRGERNMAEYFVYFTCSECGVNSEVKVWPGNPLDLPMKQVKTTSSTEFEESLSICSCGRASCSMCGHD